MSEAFKITKDFFESEDRAHKPDCVEGVLCDPAAEFEMLERCKICKKII
tara:strand:- start:143 stop:289 length:147 start_codon:yes stop_codon:yes gene_type:complete